MRTPFGAAVAIMAAAPILSACGSVPVASSHPLNPAQPYRVVDSHVPQLPVPEWSLATLSVPSQSTVAAIIDGELALTQDGGKTWTTEPLPPEVLPDAVSFVSATTGWLLANTGSALNRPAIYVTTDRGKHWQRQLTGASSELGGTLDMVSAQVGWAIVSGTLYRTVDGGLRWTAVSLPRNDDPGALAFVSATRGWVSTCPASGPPACAVLATHDAIHFHTILTNANPIAAISLSPNGTGHVLVGALGGTIGFGPVLQTTNDGRSWATVATAKALAQGGAFGFPAGMAFDGTTGWIGTTNGAQGFSPNGLLVTTDGGSTWHAVGGPFGWAIQGVAMTAPGQGWIAANGPGARTFLAHTTDNGAHWTVAWPPPAPRFVDFLTSRVGYGVGLAYNARAIVRTRDGGQHWILESAPPGQPFTASAFSKTIDLGMSSTFVGTEPVTNIFQSQSSGRSFHLLTRLRNVNASSLRYIGGRMWVMTVQANLQPKIGLEISADNGRHWSHRGLNVAAGDAVSVVSPRAAWVFFNPARGSASHLGHLSLITLSGTVQKTVLALPRAGTVQDAVTAIDFLNTRDGWVAVTQFVRSHTLIHKPGSQRLVHSGSVANLLYYTTDGGRAWSIWKLPNTWNVNGLDLVTSRLGYLTVNGAVLKTTDGGGTWRLASR